MSNLQIIKQSAKVWQHVDSVLGSLIVSDFYFVNDNNKFQLVSKGRAYYNNYDIPTQVTVIDETDGGTTETFIDALSLSIRLEQLGYPGFPIRGEVSSIFGLIEAGTNVTITGAGTAGNPYVINSSGGGGGIESVTGSAVDNTDPLNPIVNVSTLQEVMENGRSYIQTVGDYTYTFQFAGQEMTLQVTNNVTEISNVLNFGGQGIGAGVFNSGGKQSLNISDIVEGSKIIAHNEVETRGNEFLVPFKTVENGISRFLPPNNKAEGDYTLALAEDLANKADLVGGLIPAAQLPPTVDEILEFANFASFPSTGVSNFYYLDLATNKTYRWSGTQYVPINEGIALGETSSTAYRGDRGKVAYDHSQTTGNPHGTSKNDVGLGNVDNTSDANKPISTATQTALDNRITTVIKDAVQSGNTSGTLETLLKTYNVAGVVYTSGDALDFIIGAIKTAGVGSSTLRVKVNTVNDFATATLIATAGAITSARNYGVERKRIHFDGTTLKGLSGTASAVTDISATGNSDLSITLNPANQFWIYLSIQSAISTDVGAITYFKLTR